LENLGKKLPNQKAESCPNWPSLYIPLLLAKIFFQDFFPRLYPKTLLKKAAFFEAAFLRKVLAQSWKKESFFE
jgi:hypothetical protein